MRCVLKRLDRDFDSEKLKTENPRFGRIVSALEDLADSDGGRFMNYCKEKFLESILGEKKKDNE